MTLIERIQELAYGIGLQLKNKANSLHLHTIADVFGLAPLLKQRCWSGTVSVTANGVAAVTFPSGYFTAAPIVTAVINVANATAVQNLGGASVVTGTLTANGCSIRAHIGNSTVIVIGGNAVSMRNAPNGTVINVIAVQYLG